MLAYLRQKFLRETKERFAKFKILSICRHVLLSKLKVFAKNGVHDRGNRRDIGPRALDWQEGAVNRPQGGRRSERLGTCACRFLDTNCIPGILE